MGACNPTVCPIPRLQARSRLYDTSTYFSWIYGILKSYDLSDTVAAMLSLPKKIEVLVLGPCDELLRPLSRSAATEEYAFAASVGGNRLTVQPGPAGDDSAVLAAVLKWLLP